jgi:predicted secreted protein
MATQGYVKGHNLRLFIGTAGVGHATDCSMSIDIDTKELSDKDVDPGSTAPGAVALIVGKKRVTLTSNGYVVESDNGSTPATGGYRTQLANTLAGVAVAWKFTTNATGDTVVSGNGIITKFSANAPDEGEATYSIEIKGTGTFDDGIVA